MRASQMRVLQLFTEYGDMDDRALLRVAKAAGVKMSDSGLRSRRSELAKPNMDRLDTLANDWLTSNHNLTIFPELYAMNPPSEPLLTAAYEWARRTLRIEGFRSPIWDTGRRVAYEGGRQGIVWGKAV